MVRFAPSDTLTSMTPVSFVDDGVRIDRRLPRRGPWDINKWLEGTSGQRALSATATSAYTGSYVDDGADMLHPDPESAVPGFGKVDKKFYSKGQRAKDTGLWTDAMARAVGGDIQRSLTKTRQFDNVRIIDAKQKAKDKKEAQEKSERKMREGEIDEDGAVCMKLPPTWGDFIIECPDGRVIVVDKDGTYDSGLPGEHVVDSGPSKMEKEERKRKEKEQERQKRRDERKRREEEAAAAKATAKSSARSHKGSRQKRSKDHSHREQRREHRHGSNNRKQSSSSTAKRFAPIIEVDRSDSESGVGSDVPSLINYCTISRKNARTKLPLAPSPCDTWTSLAPSPIELASEAKWETTPVAGSQSVTEPDDWKQNETWEDTWSMTKPSSGVPSQRFRRSTSSQHSSSKVRTEHRRGEDPWTQLAPLEPVRSPTKSVTFEAGCYEPDVEDFYTYITPETVIYRGLSPEKSHGSWGKPTSTDYTSTTTSKSVRSQASPTKTSICFDQIWAASSRSRSSTQASMAMSESQARSRVLTVTDEDIVSEHHTASDDESKVSTVQPYSWRRDEEDESTHSTTGSIEPGSVFASDTEPGMWQKDDEEAGLWVDNGDAKSVKSTTSTYHRPTVEDVPETSEEEAQEWPTSTEHVSEWSSTAAGDFNLGAAEGAVEQPCTWNGSQHGSSGKWTSKKADSGYEEDNETWLNTEVGGVKFREAVWRISGKDA